MTKVFSILLTMLLSTLAVAAEPTKVIVECKEHALIRGNDVLIRDVAKIATDLPDLSMRLAEIQLAKRPAYGINRILSRHDILMQLVKVGIRADQVKFTGAEEIVVQPQSTLMKPADLIEVADPVLAAALEGEINSDIEFEMSGKLRSLNVPPGRVSLNLLAKLDEIRPSSATVTVSIMVDGESFKDVDIQYRLRRFTEVLVTSRAIKGGTPFGIDNLERRRLLITPGSNLNVTDYDQIIGKVAARDISVDKPVTLGHLADPKIIFAKQLVSLVMRSRRIKIESEGQALRDGSIGERIPVMNLSTRKQTWGLVTAPGVVSLNGK
ncbi:MAG: flagellar basal body P-ring formation chaperone FlgA [Planctomycetota bacterium]|jgi:flagella basal body P-ring formation protein FlgA